MIKRRTANPFVPGRGGLPPNLAVMIEEQGNLLDLLAYLRACRSLGDRIDLASA